MDKNILLFMEHRTEHLENNISLGMKSSIGWKELTFKGLSILSKRLANHLIDLGIDKGDNVAILSESMPEWGAALFASIMAGSTTIPLDIKLTKYELNHILTDCRPRIMLVSSAYLEKAIEMQKEIDSIEHIILIDDTGANRNYISMYTLEDKPDRKWRHRNLNKTAFVIYTSGTTGSPKGVEITFENVISQVEAIGKSFDLGKDDNLLSILPMNHLFELTVGFLSFLSMGTSIYYSKSLKPKDLFPIFTEKKITFMVVVPAFLKLLKTSIESEIKTYSPIKKFLYDISYNLAEMINCYKLRRFLFRNIHKKFGGKFKGFISGGAPLDINVGKFFQTIGLKIYEGYGLSEASPVISVNVEGANRLGSVGRPLFNVEAKIDAETGELMVKGPSVMKGYFKKPEMTKEVITEEGWLKTGDIARIDKDGFIWITGRIKNMIVLPGGKKVFPEEVEAVLEQSDMFQEVCVVGQKHKIGQKEGSEDVCAVIVPRADISEAHTNDLELKQEISKEVKKLATQLSTFKRPTNIIVSRELLPRTATKKIKRKDVAAMTE
ncbi:MAG: AMP-binding protein [Candidatus Gastranaerophilales bacterium]|nr:AMP-binding protein [Candidatus Gastranaerophilales bacterium]